MRDDLRLGVSGGSCVLGGHLAIIEQLLQYFQPLIFLIILEILADFMNLLLHLGILHISLHKTRLESLDLGIKEAECARIGDFQARKSI